MKSLIKIEELLIFGLAIVLFLPLDFAWWWFLVLFLVPDVGMLGYLFGPRVGAWCYNATHHKGLAIVLYVAGIHFEFPWLQLSGLIMLGHSSFDRMLGYGLKYPDSFRNTHLGTIGRA